jgi:hypothetical protein
MPGQETNMKMQLRSARRIALALAVGLLAAIGVVWNAGPVAALNFTRLTTGMVGVARGQTFRTKVVNTGETRGFIINWAVLNADGQIVSASRGPTALMLGHAAFFDVHFDEFPTESIRGELRALVVIHGSSVNASTAFVTGEVFDDDTGKTTSTQRLEECACGTQ